MDKDAAKAIVNELTAVSLRRLAANRTRLKQQVPGHTDAEYKKIEKEMHALAEKLHATKEIVGEPEPKPQGRPQGADRVPEDHQGTDKGGAPAPAGGDQHKDGEG